MAYGRRTYRKRGMRKRTKSTPFKRVSTRKLVTQAKTKSLIKLIKGVTLKQSETCYKTLSQVGRTFTHDTLGDVPIWNGSLTTMFPSQGLTDGERRGDEILAQGIMYRGVYQVPHDRRNMRFKMWFLQFNTNQGNHLSYSDFFHNISGNSQLDPIQSDRWKGIRYLGSFRCRASDQNTDAANPEDKTIFVKRWIPLKKKITFISDGSAVIASGLKECGVLVIAPYDSISSYTTDTVINNSEHTFTLYYKDP